MSPWREFPWRPVVPDGRPDRSGAEHLSHDQLERAIGRCEHGNAIISRDPIGNVRLIRHRRTRSWNSRVQRLVHVGQPRLGGRVAIAADIRVGDRLVRTYAVHFESGHVRRGPSSRDADRSAQARELIANASDVPHGVVIGGDMNVVRHLKVADDHEPTVSALAGAGFVDGHAALPRHERRRPIPVSSSI